MATVQVIENEISRLGGIPASTLRTIARRLGESGLLPRGGRGTKLQRLSALDCARMIIGVMRVADGTAARVDLQVAQVETLQAQAEISFATDDSWAALQGAIRVVSPGSFLRQVESLISRLGTNEQSQLLAVVAAVGLTTGANSLWGWVEPRPGIEFVRDGTGRFYHVCGLSRVVFANGDINCSGFTREVRMTSEALCEIASLCRDGSDARHGSEARHG